MTADLGGSSAKQAGPWAVQEQCWAFRLTLPPQGQAAGVARQATRDTLSSWGIGHVTETVVLLVSELVGNAVRHARTGRPLELRLEAAGSWLQMEVLDGDPQPPLPRIPATFDESGFGFVLIEALADKWGVREHEPGKAVWAALDTGHEEDQLG
jgi:anti-sigma regulatory factor (Ser/Thr protein kinase)